MKALLRKPGSKLELNAIRQAVLTKITASPVKISPPVLENFISKKYGLDRKQIKSLIRTLVTEGELIYTYEYGMTFLEKSFHKPVRLSKHVVLKPPDCYYTPKSDDRVVQIKPGVSFGAGRHPTTRLAIRGIDFALTEHAVGLSKSVGTTVLDIGTGSGILLITALMFGIKKGVGIDIDPCARAEAMENAKLNGLQYRLEVSDDSFEDIQQQFSIILANLRLPTLKKYSSRLSTLAMREAILVLSGIRTGELRDLLDVYAAHHFECIGSLKSLGWAGVVLQKIN